MIGAELLLKGPNDVVGGVFNVDELVSGGSDGANDLIKLQMYSLGVPILGVLDEHYKEESEDGGSCINEELPSIGEIEEWA